MATMHVLSARRNVLLLTVMLAGAAPLPTAETPPLQEATPIPAKLPQFSPVPLRFPETMQRVTALEFSPDGKYLASAHGWFERGGSLQVWDVKTGKRVGLQVLPIGISSLGWTADGRHLAISVWDSTVRVYAFPAMEQKARIGIDRSVARLALSPDGKQIVTAAEGHAPRDESAGRVVQIWDAASGALVRTCESEKNLFRLTCAAWSPGGKYVAAAGGYYDRPIGLGRVWLAESGKEVARLEGHAGMIRAMRFFPDDSRIATAGIDGTVRIWDPATGMMESQFTVGSVIDGLDVSPDGSLMASGTPEGALALWSPEQKRKVADLSRSGPDVLSVAFARDGQHLASGGADGIIHIWSVPERKLVQELPVLGSDDRPGAIQALGSVADGRITVVGYGTGLLRAVDAARQTELWQLETGKGKSPTAIAVSPDHKRLFVGYEDGALRLHSADDGSLKLEMKKMPVRIATAVFGRDGRRLACGDVAGRVWLWDDEGRTVRAQRHDHRGAVLALGFPDKDDLVASIGVDGKAVCRKVLTDEVVAEARLNPGPILSARISADGSTAVVIGQQITVWDAVAFAQRSIVGMPVQPRTTMAISADGSLVVIGHALGTWMFDGRQQGTVTPIPATASREGGVFALSTDNRALMQGTRGGALIVWRSLPPQVSPLARIRRAGNAVALATSSDGKWLATGGDDAQVTVWDLQTGEVAETLPGGAGTIYACQFSADSQMLVSANLAGSVKVWRVKDWTLQGALMNPQRPVRSVAFSADGRWLATGGSDRSLMITDTRTWETVAEQPNQDHWVEGLAFAPDGSRLYSVTGSWDVKDHPVASTLTAWKIKTEKGKPGLELEPIKKITAHSGTSDNLVATPDARYVVTGSAEGKIKVWDAKTLDPIRSMTTPTGVHRMHLMRSDPALVVLGDHGGGVSVWNVHTGACIANYAGHVGHVFDVTSTSDGRLLVSAGEDDFLMFWPGPNRGPDDALKRFLKRVVENRPE